MSPSRPLARPGESTDPRVHQLLAEHESHRIMRDDAVRRIEKGVEDRDFSQAALDRLGAELRALGFVR
jgi:hypothetical protein